MTDELSPQAIDKMKRYQLVSGGDAPAFGVGGMTDKRWREFYQTMQSVRALLLSQGPGNVTKGL